MTAPVDVCNLGLAEIGNRIQIASFNDGTAASKTAALFYTPKMQMLSRSANWDSFRAQIPLTLLKATVVNGQLSNYPPPQPWAYEYAWPSDCLKARFIQPTLNAPGSSNPPLTTAPNVYIPAPGAPTGIPFVVATDVDALNNPIKVILTNLPNAQLIYTRDLTQVPDLWDALFLAGATALLASYFISALARDKEQMAQQVQVCKSVIDQARAANGNEAISSVDHYPDWMMVRYQSAVSWAWNQQGPNGVVFTGWDQCAFPDGQSY